MKITKLTEQQDAQIAAERKRYFDLATSTTPADRQKAEAAVCELADLAGVKINRVVWVNNPENGKREHDAAWDSLWASLWDSLRDTEWMSFYAVPHDILGVKYAEDAQRKLDLWVATLHSCFAVWIVPGTAILCERPATVEIRGGKLVGLTWRTE